MKRLISAKEIYSAKENNETIIVDKNTLITPQAKDVAKELGVIIQESDSICRQDFTMKEEETEKAKDTEKGDSKACQDAALCEDEIYKVMNAALSKGIWTKEQLENLMGSLK